MLCMTCGSAGGATIGAIGTVADRSRQSGALHYAGRAAQLWWPELKCSIGEHDAQAFGFLRGRSYFRNRRELGCPRAGPELAHQPRRGRRAGAEREAPAADLGDALDAR